MKNIKKTKRLRIDLILAFFLPLSFVVCWHFFNRGYPRNDESFYFITSQDIYLSFKDNFLKGFWDLFFHRSWKPILHPPIGAVFLVICLGNVLAAIASTMIFYYAVFLYFTIALLKEFLRGYRLVLIAIFLATIPWVVKSAYLFNSEMPFLAASVAAFYFLKKSEYLKFNMNSMFFAVSLSLAFCIRPIESFLAFLVPLLVFVRRSYFKKKVGKRDIGVSILFTIISAAYAAYYIVLKQNPSEVITFFAIVTVLLSVWVVRYSAKSLKLSEKYIRFFAIFMSIIFVWYAAYPWGAYNWAYMSSFGQWAEISGGRSGISSIQFVYNLFAHLGGFLLFIFAALFAFGVFLYKATFFQKKQFTKDDLWIYGSVLIVPILLGCFSHSMDMRYYYLGFYLLFLFVLVCLLQKNNFIAHMSAVILSFLVLVQVTVLLQFTFGRLAVLDRTLNIVKKFRMPWPEHELIPTRNQDAIVDLYESMKGVLPNKTMNQKMLRVAILQMFKESDLDWVADPWALTIVSRERGRNWLFERPWDFEFSTIDARYGSIKKRYEYVLVGPITGKTKPYTNPMSEVGKRYLSEKRSQQAGTRISIRSRHFEAGQLLLIPQEL